MGRGRGGRQWAVGCGGRPPSQALSIIEPTAIVRPAVASAMLVLKLIADAGGQRQPAVSRLPTSATRTLAPLRPSPSAPLAAVKRKCGEERYVIILDFCATPLLYRNYSLTIWAPSKEHCANYERCVTKQSRILPMKTLLISATSAVFLLGTAFAREVVISRVVTPAFAREVFISRVVTPHGASIVERHTAQLNSASGVLCGTKYITTTSSDGKRTTRKSVDCEE